MLKGKGLKTAVEKNLKSYLDKWAMMESKKTHNIGAETSMERKHYLSN